MTSRKRKLKDLGAYEGPLDIENSQDGTGLTWRSDPDANFSDWSVVVNTPRTFSGDTNEEKKEEDLQVQRQTGAKESNNAGLAQSISPSRLLTVEYHVHKAVIGLGPRGSQYFLNVFRMKGLRESDSSTTTLQLQPSAAKAFPVMLDYMYTNPLSRDSDVEATSDTAVALRHLANYFGVPTLHTSVNEFIDSDLNASNVHIYLKEAQIYHDDKLIDAALSIVADNWRDILVSSDGESYEIPDYIKNLPQSKQIALFQQSLLQTVPIHDELKRYKRWTEGSRGSGDAPERTLPRLGDRQAYGRYTYIESDGLASLFPLFYYDHTELNYN